MTLRRVAEEVFGKPPAWLYRRIAAFREAGFPAPLPGTREWDPQAIAAWLAGLGTPAGGKAAEAAAEDNTLRRRLAEMRELPTGPNLG